MMRKVLKVLVVIVLSAFFTLLGWFICDKLITPISFTKYIFFTFVIIGFEGCYEFALQKLKKYF